MEGWRFNPPRNWPTPPEGWEPGRGWRPRPEWGPLPPGHQLWLPERPQARKRTPSLVALGLVAGFGVAGLVLPINTGLDDAPSLASLTRPASVVSSVPTPEAGSSSSTKHLSSKERSSSTKRFSSKKQLKQVKSTTVKRFASCATLRETYPHGVGRRTAKDHTTGVPVTDFARDARVYAANPARDGDGDGIACEK